MPALRAVRPFPRDVRWAEYGTSLPRLRSSLLSAGVLSVALLSTAGAAPRAPVLVPPALAPLTVLAPPMVREAAPGGGIAALAAPQTRLTLEDPLERAFGWDRFGSPQTERPAEPGFYRGAYGARSWPLVPQLSLAPREGEGHDTSGPVTAAAPLLADDDGRLHLDLLSLGARSTKKPCVRRAVTLVRYGGEQDTFSILGCDGAILPDVLDRVSVLARPPGAERPPLPLPEEPDPVALADGEWVTNVRLVSPRLAWVLSRVAEAFPRRTIYLMSGYRRGGHDGAHGKGRALDLFVMGVANERVYKFCRTLPDVGCGYYPNNKFVHLDVRRPGSGKAFWIDTSGPGEPSNYVDAWPGVERSGAAVWMGGATATGAPKEGR